MSELPVNVQNITPVCRQNRTPMGALEEAISRVRQSYIAYHDSPANEEVTWRLSLVRVEAKQGDWRPIAEAPKDGTRLLLAIAEKEPVIGWWGSEEYWAGGHWRHEDEAAPDLPWGPFEPTHYMPLPSPPSEQDGDNDAS